MNQCQMDTIFRVLWITGFLVLQCCNFRIVDNLYLSFSSKLTVTTSYSYEWITIQFIFIQFKSDQINSFSTITLVQDHRDMLLRGSELDTNMCYWKLPTVHFSGNLSIRTYPNVQTTHKYVKPFPMSSTCLNFYSKMN